MKSLDKISPGLSTAPRFRGYFWTVKNKVNGRSILVFIAETTFNQESPKERAIKLAIDDGRMLHRTPGGVKYSRDISKYHAERKRVSE